MLMLKWLEKLLELLSEVLESVFVEFNFVIHLLAYVEMLGRDRSRLVDCRKRLNELPLGSAALAGTSYPIDRHFVADKLDFDRPTANSMDAVSDRDFAVEFISSASLIAIHLSRLAEELVIW